MRACERVRACVRAYARVRVWTEEVRVWDHCYMVLCGCLLSVTGLIGGNDNVDAVFLMHDYDGSSLLILG